MKSRIISLFISLALIISMVPSALASEIPSRSAEEILAEFHHKSFTLSQLQASDSSSIATHTSESLDSIRHETVAMLVDNGYEAYEVTSSTYDTVEEHLNTDLLSMGIQKDSSYIVIVGDISTEMTQRIGSAGASYPHTYGGVTYNLRDVTVTTADSSNYTQVSTKDLLERRSDAIIEGMINATVSAYATAVGVPAIFGTIGSITGLTAIHFSSSKSTSAILHAGSSWTRIFTQVWDNGYNSWVQGSSVEYVNKTCYVNGLRHDSTSNKCIPYTSNNKTNTSYSPNYSDKTWRKDNAVVSYRGALPIIRDSVGDVCYEYDSKVIITHSGGFI